MLTTSDASSSSIGENYFAYVGGVYQCWRGSISNINFFDNGNVAFESRADFIAKDLAPCCSGVTGWWTADNISLPNTILSFVSDSSTSASDSGSTLSSNAIIGIAVGGGVGLLSLIAGLLYWKSAFSLFGNSSGNASVVDVEKQAVNNYEVVRIDGAEHVGKTDGC
jgi:hypothetical protein